MCIGLLPAAIFMLCPASAYPKDVEILSELFKSVYPLLTQESVLHATKEWHQRRYRDLSGYSRSRFQQQGGTPSPIGTLSESEPIEPPGFTDLTFSQACMTVGALFDVDGQHWNEARS